MYRTARRISMLVLAITVVGAASWVLPAPSVEAQASSATPTATPRADERPDSCEPNGDQAHACRITLDTVSGPFTFLPEGDQDYYSLFLGDQPNGLETAISVRGTSGLEIYSTIRRADSGTVLATIASPAISTTLAADVTGWVVLRVENRAGAIASGQSYRVEVRRVLPATPATPTPSGPLGMQRASATPDALENNYSPETAAPIGIGVSYDLTFVCPVVGGCAGGDHDYLRVEVKAGVRYLLSTFDLAPGVDTVLDLFWWNPTGGWQLLATNDDTRPGSAFLSTLRWQAPADGPAILRIGPRDGGLAPILDAPPTYRFAMALADSPLAAELEARIALQTNAPTPIPATAPTTSGGATSASGSTTAPAVPAISIEQGQPAGLAMVIRDAAAHTAPDATSPVIGTIPLDALVQLSGCTADLWAEVTSDEIVGAAWVDRRALRPAPSIAGVDPAAPGGATPVAGTTLPGVPSGVPSGAPGPLTITDAPPRTLGIAGTPARPVSAEVTVT
ncbi:MAG: hypothetical protein WCG26_13790, partial [Chloroflexales bacterium]